MAALPHSTLVVVAFGAASTTTRETCPWRPDTFEWTGEVERLGDSSKRFDTNVPAPFGDGRLHGTSVTEQECSAVLTQRL